MEHIKVRNLLAVTIMLAFAICLACGLAGCSCASDDGGQAKAPASISEKKRDARVTVDKPVAKVDETDNGDGSRTIVYTFEDGTTQTVTIAKDETGGGSGVSDEPVAGDEGAGTGSDSGVSQGELPGDGSTEFEQFMAKSSEEQFAYFQTFGDPAAFLEWFNAAKADYQAKHPSIVIGEGDVIQF